MKIGDDKYSDGARERMLFPMWRSGKGLNERTGGSGRNGALTLYHIFRFAPTPQTHNTAKIC